MARTKVEKHPCIYVADTECTTSIDYDVHGHVYAYLMDMMAVDTADMTTTNATALPKDITYSGPDCIGQWVEGFLEKIPENAQIWFYNTRYDASFILDWLMNKEGYVSYTWDDKERIKQEKKEAIHKYLMENPDRRGTIGLDADGEVYFTRGKNIPRAVVSQWEPRRVIHPIRSGSKLISCEIYNSKGNKLTLLDVGNKYTQLPDWDEANDEPISGVQAIAVMLGGSKTPLDICYRGEGYMPNEQEITRCHYDTVYIKKAIEIMFSMGLTASTLAGDAWSIYKAIRDIGIYGDDKTGKKQALLHKLGIEVEMMSLPDDGILDRFPEIVDFQDGETVDIREAYKGGVTIVNKKYAGKKIKLRKGKRLVHDDCNSMHPTSMECKMPYGEYWRSYEPEGDFYIMKCQCRFKLKEGKFPVISNPYGIDGAEWLEEGDKLLTLTSYDWEWIKKHYDIEIIGKRRYVNWNTRVNEANMIYVEHFKGEKARWKEVKKKSTDEGEKVYAGVMYHVNKIMMNALYGKFGQDPVKPWEWCKIKDGAIAYGSSNVEMGEFDDPLVHKYLPMACAITGCSRDRLWDHFDRIGWENVTYGDTDSAFYFTECENDDELNEELRKKGINVHPTDLGAWDVEDGLGDKITEAKFVRAKVYGYVKESKKITIKTAGLPIEARKKMKGLDEMYLGAVFTGAKKIPMNVPGGQILIETDFTLKDH